MPKKGQYAHEPRESTKRAMQVRCPVCGAKPDERCKTPKGQVILQVVHFARREVKHA